MSAPDSKILLTHLASVTGRNVAIFLSKNTFDGSFWDLKRLSDFQKRLPFMCRRTIERSIKRLREAGYIKTEVTRLRTLAFTIVADKVNTVEGIAEELKVPEPPALGKVKTKFYKEEYKVQGTNDLWYIVRTFRAINEDVEYEDVLGLDKRRNVDILYAVVGRIGKHQLMEDVRDSENCFEMFADGKWDEYLDYANERLEHTFMCEDCEQPYDERYGCVCGGVESAQLSYT